MYIIFVLNEKTDNYTIHINTYNTVEIIKNDTQTNKKEFVHQYDAMAYALNMLNQLKKTEGATVSDVLYEAYPTLNK